MIDGSNLVMRAFHATQGRTVLSADGVNTAPTLVTINLLSKYIKQEQPHRVVVCWDGGRSFFRTSVYEHYKVKRTIVDPERDEEERTHFGLVREFLSLAGIHHVRVEHVEADDLIAHYWRIKESNERVVILSGDKDFLQLLDGWTEQIRPGGDFERWTVNRVRTEMQCKPEHMPYVMALTGDPGDGVPGIPGFGRKTACKHLAKYDWDLFKLLDAGEKRLFGERDNVLRNLQLVDLRSANIGIDLPHAPMFSPTTPESAAFPELISWLDRYAMETVKSRLLQHALWVADAPLRLIP